MEIEVKNQISLEKIFSKETWKWLVTISLLLLVILIAWDTFNFSAPKADKSKWQAVFLTNGQVYFGHLQVLSKEYIKLNSIYYLQVQQPVQPQTGGGQSNINLVKLGGEIHGPEDTMFIPADRVLFWENLRADSQVIKVIEQINK